MHSAPWKSSDGTQYVTINQSGTVRRFENGAFLIRPGKAARKAAKRARQKARKVAR